MTYNLDNLRVTEGHKSLAAYIKSETGKQVKPEQIALVDALRVEFRKDPEQVQRRADVRAQARQRKLDALAKAEAKAAALRAELDGSSPQVTQVEGKVHLVSGTVAMQFTPEESEEDHGTEVAFVPMASAPEPVDDFDDAPLADVVPFTGNTFGEDTSAIEVTESSDDWETNETTGFGGEDDF